MESKEIKKENSPKNSLVPPNYNEICDKLLADMNKDYEKTLAATKLKNSEEIKNVEILPSEKSTEEIQENIEEIKGEIEEGYQKLEENPDEVF